LQLSSISVISLATAADAAAVTGTVLLYRFIFSGLFQKLIADQ